MNNTIKTFRNDFLLENRALAHNAYGLENRVLVLGHCVDIISCIYAIKCIRQLVLMANNNFPKENNMNKEFYNNSALRPNVVAELCNEITANENIDINVEKVKRC
jgi:hypothetical protein